MSALIISALAATAMAAAPASFGSEPYVFGLDEGAPAAQTRTAAAAPTLVTSLGSEPFAVGVENMASERATGGNAVEQRAEDVTLATSLGSEPFILGGSENVAPAGARHARAPASSEKVVRN